MENKPIRINDRTQIVVDSEPFASFIWILYNFIPGEHPKSIPIRLTDLPALIDALDHIHSEYCHKESKK